MANIHSIKVREKKKKKWKKKKKKLWTLLLFVYRGEGGEKTGDRERERVVKSAKNGTTNEEVREKKRKK